MALKHMASKVPGERTSAKEVVDETGCPFDATARVLQTLVHKGLLQSEQGAHGGYLLVRDLSKVTLYELIEAILGPLGVVRCLHGEESCELIDRCNIVGPIGILNRKLVEFYRSLSVAELLKVKESPHLAELVREVQV